MKYLICLYSAAGQVIGDEVMHFENDAAAMDHGREFLWPWGHEIWAGSRLVRESWPTGRVYQTTKLAKAA